MKKAKTFEEYVDPVYDNQYLGAEEEVIAKALKSNKEDSTINAEDMTAIKRVLTKHNVPHDVIERKDDYTLFINMNKVAEPNLELEQLFDLFDGLDGIEAEIDGNIITLSKDTEITG